VKKRLDEYRGVGGDMGMGMGMPAARPAGFSLRNLRTFSSFKNPVYRLYFGGMMGEMAAMNVQMLARSLLIFRLTNSPAILGAMSLAFAIPMLSLALFGGVIADRVQKKYVLLFGQAASAVLSLGVALALALGYLSPEKTGSWWILVVSAVFQGAIMALVMPSRQAILPEIVGGEQLMNAISLSSMGTSILRLFAPALSGFLIDALGFEAVYYTTTGLYLVAVAFITLLPRTSTTTIRGRGALTGMKEGINYLRRETTLLFILGFTLIMTVLSMPYQQMLPIFTDTILKVDNLPVGASGMGVLMSVSGAGSMVGSFVLASLPNKKRGLMLLISSTFLGVALASFAFSTLWPLSLSLVVFVGLGQMGQMTLSNTLLQYYVNEEYLGRVMSILMMQFGLMSLGTFVAGLLAEAMGVQWAVGGFATLLAFLSILALVFLRRVRNLD